MENFLKMEFLTGIVATVISSLALTTLMYFIKKQFKTNKEVKEKQAATEKGVRALLRDRIIQLFNSYSAKKCMPIYARENAESLYKEYMALGGNGTIKGLVDNLMRLPVGNPENADNEDSSTTTD